MCDTVRREKQKRGKKLWCQSQELLESQPPLWLSGVRGIKPLMLCKYRLGVPYREMFKVRVDVALSSLNKLKVSWSFQGRQTRRCFKPPPNPSIFIILFQEWDHHEIVS